MIKGDRKTILIMGIIIFVLLVILFYFFVFNPMINNYVYEKQVEAQDMLIEGIVMQIDQMDYATLSFGNETLFLVPVVDPNENSS